MPSVTLFLFFSSVLFILAVLSPLRPLDGLVVSWKRDGRRLASGRRLIIPAATSADSGLYVCEASLGNSTTKPVEARAHLIVMGKEKSTYKHTIMFPQETLHWLTFIS